MLPLLQNVYKHEIKMFTKHIVQVFPTLFKDSDWLRMIVAGTIHPIGSPFVRSCIYFIKTSTGV